MLWKVKSDFPVQSRTWWVLEVEGQIWFLPDLYEITWESGLFDVTVLPALGFVSLPLEWLLYFFLLLVFVSRLKSQQFLPFEMIISGKPNFLTQL